MEIGYMGRINYKRQWMTVEIVNVRKSEADKYGIYPVEFVMNGQRVSVWNKDFDKVWNPNGPPSWHSEPATQAQINKLQRCGVSVTTKLTKKQASDLIEQHGHKDTNNVRCCECGRSVSKSSARWDSGMGGWYCGC